MKQVLIPVIGVFVFISIGAVCPILALILVIPLIAVMIFGNVFDALRK